MKEQYNDQINTLLEIKDTSTYHMFIKSHTPTSSLRFQVTDQIWHNSDLFLPSVPPDKMRGLMYTSSDDDFNVPPNPTPSALVELNTNTPYHTTTPSQTYQYYKYTLTRPNADLIISLTVYNNGDPDIYASEYPYTTPTKANHTYISANLGADTLTIQANDPKKVCTPDPSFGHICDFYIGVYTWSALSAEYSIVISEDTGYFNGTSLLELKPGRPQSGVVVGGRYAYFKCETAASDATISVTVSF